jgi:hypothetical protein
MPESDFFDSLAIILHSEFGLEVVISIYENYAVN